MKKLHNIFCFPKIDNDEDIRFCEMIEQILILSHICDVFEQDSTGNKHMFKEEKWGGERKRENDFSRSDRPTRSSRCWITARF